MKPLNQSLHHAMPLMRSGDLRAATRAIQQGLATDVSRHARCKDAVDAADLHTAPDCIDVEFRVVDRDGQAKWHDPAAKGDPGTPGEFTSQRFFSEAGELGYKLYVPAGLELPPATSSVRDNHAVL